MPKTKHLIQRNDQGTRLLRQYLHLINRSNPTFGPQNIKGHLRSERNRLRLNIGAGATQPQQFVCRLPKVKFSPTGVQQTIKTAVPIRLHPLFIINTFHSLYPFSPHSITCVSLAFPLCFVAAFQCISRVQPQQEPSGTLTTYPEFARGRFNYYCRIISTKICMYLCTFVAV